MGDSRFSNYNMCCRLCLTENLDSVKSIFDNSPDDRSMQQKIAASIGVEIQAEDKLSTLVCNPCMDMVNQWSKYKQSCLDNQLKLEQWMQLYNGDGPDMNIQIKEEPVEHNESTENAVATVDIHVKSEPVDHSFEDAPPPLTPQGTEEMDVDTASMSQSCDSADGEVVYQCTICGKEFDADSNRKRHEKMVHKNHRSIAPTLPKPEVETSNKDNNKDDKDDKSRKSLEVSSKESNGKVVVSKELDGEEKKILFAAGLKLLLKNSAPPISQENLSKIELSYIEKCKAMASMYNTLECACHNVQHPNLKGLLSHLRSLRIWFPVFTCYHCMITFTDRSTSTKHHLKCTRTDLETLVKLSNLRKRSEVKTRLYQNYKCTSCKFMYSFHEDFCTHVDEDHSLIKLPKNCSCGRVFTTLEDYKDHAYVSCLVDYYCDVCFITVKSLEAFKKHAVQVHDESEGFILLQDDNYRRRKPVIMSPDTQLSQMVEQELHELPAKRKRKSFTSLVDQPEEFVDSSDEKVINPLSDDKITGHACPICSKEYSSNNNMMRHYRTHALDESVDDSLYCCPDCGGMFSTREWERHKTTHTKKKCSECGKTFQFQTELDQHRSVHLNLKLYRDSKTQSYKSTMVNSNSEDNIAVVCDICDTMFISKEQLKEHKLTHEQKMPVLESQVNINSDNKFPCTLCPKSYPVYGSLWDHNKKKHPENKTPRNRSGQNFERMLTLENSQFGANIEEEEANDVETESYYNCKRCFKVFSNRYTLKNHMKCHGINSATSPKNTKLTKKVWCDLCHSVFDNLAKLKQHKLDDHARDSKDLIEPKEEQEEGDVPLLFTCDVCVQTFTSRVALKKHKEQHDKEPHFRTAKCKNDTMCKHCKISFDTIVQLNTHMSREHNEPKPKRFREKIKQYSCDICKKNFNSSTALCAHQGWHKRGKIHNKFIKSSKVMPKPVIIKQETRETESVTFECKTCGAVLSNDTALQIHILEKHRNVNAVVVPSRCTMCNLDFSSQGEYEKHQRFHTVVDKQAKKSFPCNHCPLTFPRMDALNTHMRQNHKFVCHQCDRVFDKQTSLSIHLKVHEKQRIVSGSNNPNPKPLFSCSICNKGFELPKELRAHTIDAHPF